MRCLLLLALGACNTAPKTDSSETVPPAEDLDRDGYKAEGGDCNDGDANIFPGAMEVCDGIDNNCDGTADEGIQTTFYQDSDQDGFGDATQSQEKCNAEDGWVSNALDCNDDDLSIYPGAPETCTDPEDRNCDGAAGLSDADGDGYGACEDCNDQREDINPSATEICDPSNEDENCNGLADDQDPDVDPSTFNLTYPDSDRDGYGNDQGLLLSCDETGATRGGDCDDTNAAFHPGATENCTDPEDFNCDGSVGYSDADGDRYAACEDCNDQDAGIRPGALEICDGQDNDCDGVTDPSGTYGSPTWYLDGDGDSFGDAGNFLVSCNNPGGYSQNAQDCDDGDGTIHPGAPEVCDGLDNDCDGDVDGNAVDPSLWYADRDGDGYGDPSSPLSSCDAPPQYVSDNLDCDDGDPAIMPGATEVCDGLDNDCDGVTDPSTAALAGLWYADADGDGYGDPGTNTVSCEAPAGFVADSQDCDDLDGGVHPGATEVCDGVDNDCDARIDPTDAADAVLWYADSDQDNYGDPLVTLLSCFQPSGYVANASDCQDSDPGVHPGAPEKCDGLDNDCDGLTDPSTSTDALPWYADGDGDGHGDPSQTLSACSPPSGYLGSSDDCNDAAPNVYPGAPEVCDGLDNDCDGAVDPTNSINATLWYSDSDKDNYGDPANSVLACSAPSNHVSNALDCDDGDASTYPGAPERCDGLDNDCDATVDEGLLGSGPSCSAESCLAILQDHLAVDGNYYIDFSGSPTLLTCDMTSDGGGWTLIFSDDFEGGVDPGWNQTATYACSIWSTILGGYRNIANGSLTNTATAGGVPHSQGWLELDYIKLDSWDGETAYVEADGTRLWSASLYYYQGSEVCGWNRGYSGSYDDRIAISQTFAHTGNNILIGAGSTLDQTPDDESFGIDNVYLWVR